MGCNPRDGDGGAWHQAGLRPDREAVYCLQPLCDVISFCHPGIITFGAGCNQRVSTVFL